MENTVKKEIISMNNDIIDITPSKAYEITNNDKKLLQQKGLNAEEIAIISDTTELTIPTNLFDLARFAVFTNENVNMAKKLLSLSGFPANLRKKILEKAQYYGEIWLETELKLAEELRKIKGRPGKRSDLIPANNNKGVNNKIDALDMAIGELRTKKDILRDDYDITPAQARQLVKLTEPGVKAAIEYCKFNNEVPSRALAIKYSENHKNDLSEEEKAQMKPAKCKFKFETQYAETTHSDSFGRLTEEDIPYCSLFSCAGTGEYYLPNHGLKCLLANEFAEDRAKYFSAMNPEAEMVVGNFYEKCDELIQKFKEHECKLLIATPPCQTFCRQRSKDYLSDPRLRLFIPLVRFIKEAQPQWVVIENANEFLGFSHPSVTELNGKTIGDYIRDNLEAEGYKVNFAIANAAYYGTAQNRVRSFVLASKDEIWLFPRVDRFPKVLFETIGHLPSLEAGQDSGIKYHKAPVLSTIDNKAEHLKEVFSHTATGCTPSSNFNPKYQMKGWGSFDDRGARKFWDRPSNTIESGSDNAEGLRTIHPGRLLEDGTYSDARTCTLLEIFLINGLPQGYEVPEGFYNSDNEIFMRDVMGEVLLPKMLERIIETLPVKKGDNI